MEIQTKPAILGGDKSVTLDPDDIFIWPIITSEDETAVLDVLRRGAMSSLDVTKQFEAEFAEWQRVEYALACNNGTSALREAMFACGVGIGDEIICPSLTYWASALPCFSLGATVVFADIDPVSLCIDPFDIEHRITEKTKAIVVVHYMGYPADMDPIMQIAHKHGIKVIEDVSHAHGGIYKGRKIGSIGDVSCFSLMSGKALAAGEAGMIATNDKTIYAYCIAYGHYERYQDNIETEYLQQYIGLPMGGTKDRINQLSSAVGRIQLKHYDGRLNEIIKAMNFFWDLLEDVPGIRAHRPLKNSGSMMGGWYAPHGIYIPEEVGNMSVTRYAEAVEAEIGSGVSIGCNTPLHLHPLFNSCDIYGHGKPTRIANSDRDLRQPPGSLPVTEGITTKLFSIPWFKHFRPDVIKEYANGYKKAALSYNELLAGDRGNPTDPGRWHFFNTNQ